MVAAYILYFVCKYFIRAICIEETNSLAYIVHKSSKFALKVHYTLIMNKMIVAFSFRPLTIFGYTLSCINNIELKQKNK